MVFNQITHNVVTLFMLWHNKLDRLVPPNCFTQVLVKL